MHKILSAVARARAYGGFEDDLHFQQLLNVVEDDVRGFIRITFLKDGQVDEYYY